MNEFRLKYQIVSHAVNLSYLVCGSRILIRAYKSFLVLLTSVLLFIVSSFSLSPVYAAANCGGFTFNVTPAESKIGDHTIYSNTTNIEIGFGLNHPPDAPDPDPANNGFVVAADGGGQNDYVSTPQLITDTQRSVGHWDIYVKIDNNDKYSAQFQTRSHALNLYRVSDLVPFDTSKRPPPDVLAGAIPVCTYTYQVIPLPTPTLAYVPCNLNFRMQDSRGNILDKPTLDAVYWVTGTISNMPDSPITYDSSGNAWSRLYFGDLTVGNRSTEEYTPADKQTIFKYIGTFPQPGSYRVTYDIKSQTVQCIPTDEYGVGGGVTCPRDKTGKVPTDINGHCEATINVDESGGSIDIPKVPPQCIRQGGPDTDPECTYPYCNDKCSSCPWCTNVAPGIKIPNLKPLCDQLPRSPVDYQSACNTCVNNTDETKKGIWTGIGCISTNMNTFLEEYVFRFGPGIAGGIAFLYFLYGCFLILTSAGDPEKIAQGKEIIVSALSGLLLVIFSVFLLRTIGVDILGLPEFTKP
ncbi:hypothetical protein HYW55_05785 [Candidatus Gottesmanbacteria bacterium]|nr:hypothetical protein [Candidatus Gottesmanbacteria bacterium]